MHPQGSSAYGRWHRAKDRCRKAGKVSTPANTRPDGKDPAYNRKTGSRREAWRRAAEAVVAMTVRTTQPRSSEGPLGKRGRRCQGRPGVVPVMGYHAPGHSAGQAACLTAVSCGVNGHLVLPNYGHDSSPLVAMISPHWWPSNLPTRGCRRGSGQGPHPLAGGRLGEPVAVLPLGDQHVGVMQ